MRLASLAAAALLLTSAAAAEPATPERAKAMAATIAAYLSPAAIEKGVVTVTAQGEDYVVAWDLEKALAVLDAPAGIVRMAPFVYRVAPAPGGGWFARADNFPGVAIAPSQPGERDGGKIAFDGFRFESLFDPAAPDLFRSRLRLERLSADLKSKTGGALQRVLTVNDGLLADIRIRPGAEADSVDVGMTQSSTASSQKTTLVEGDGETPLADTHQGAATAAGGVLGVRAKAFGELWRFLVAHAGEEKPPAEELRAKLTALPPLWRELGGQLNLDDVVIAFPGGSASVKSAVEHAHISGLAETSSAGLRLAFKDVAVDVAKAPGWVKSLWPASLALTLDAGVDGLDRAAKIALDDADFLRDGRLGDAARAKVADILTEGRPHVALSAARLVTPLVEATFDGEAGFGYEGVEAHARVTADGLDKVTQTLADLAQTEPDAQQLLYLAVYARGVAKTEGGRLVWDIEYLGPLSITVNGQSFPPE